MTDQDQNDLAEKTADQIIDLLESNEMPFEFDLAVLCALVHSSFAVHTSLDDHAAALKLSQMFSDMAEKMAAKDTVN
jgi:hypothetical protein